MRRAWPIGFLLLAFLLACTPQGDDGMVETQNLASLQTTSSPALSAIDSLMWRQPDSALACLLPYFDTCCRDTARHVSTVYNRHYAHLLLAELLYKNYYAQTNRLELLEAVGYFDSLSLTPGGYTHAFWRHCGLDPQSPTQRDIIAFLSARAHYINGVGYYEQDSVVPACKEYLKAVEVMEEHFEEEELVGKKAKFMALTYTHLSELFSSLFLHEQTISCAKQSLSYFPKQDSTSWHLAWVMNKIGSQYEMIRVYDSAKYYYKRAIDFIDDTTSLMYRDIASHQAMLEYKTDNQKVNTSLLNLFHLLSAAESEREYLTRYSYIGEIQFHEQQYDSAWKYLKTVYRNTPSIGLKKQAAEWLIEICKIQGRTDEIIEYAEFLVPYANHEENKSEIKSQLAVLYSEFVQYQLERQHKKETRKHLRWSMIVFSGMSLMLLFIIAIYHNNKQKKQHLEIHIEEVKQVHEMEQKALSGRLKKSNEALRELQDQIKNQNNNSSIKPRAQAASFMEEPICRLILERVREGQFKSQINCTFYKKYALSKEQLVALHDAANRHYDHFTERLVQAYPDITKSDLDYCCLHLLGLTDADMSALMQRAYNTINERNNKLRRIFGCEGMVSVTLQAFANGNTLV